MRPRRKNKGKSSSRQSKFNIERSHERGSDVRDLTKCWRSCVRGGCVGVETKVEFTIIDV